MHILELPSMELSILLLLLIAMQLLLLVVGLIICHRIWKTHQNFLNAYMNVNQDNFKFLDRREFPRTVATFAKVTGHTQPQGFFDMLRSAESTKKHLTAKRK